MNHSVKAPRRGSARSATSFSKPEQIRQRYEHYRQLAESTRDDRVTRENYWQHAEHFHRMLAEQ